MQPNLQPANLQQGLPLTSFQMMKQSPLFKLCFIGTILLIIATIVLNIVGSIVLISNYTSCYSQSSIYTNRCWNSYDYYCCKSDYSYCGQPGKCYYQDYYYSTNWGIYTAANICSGLGVLMTVVVIIMFCDFRKKARLALYNHGTNQNINQGFNNPQGNIIRYDNPGQ